MKKTPAKTINIDQLYSIGKFLSFCNNDHSSGYGKKLGVTITPEFLLACEKDEFIIPVHSQKEKILEAGKEVLGLVKYYSPFQIFLVAELCKNIVDETGFLRDIHTMDLAYQKERNTRYVNWGGQSAFNIDNRNTEKSIKPTDFNQFSIMRDFNNFVKCLHTFETLKRRNWDYHKQRLYRDAPQIQFDFSDIANLKKQLKKYHLDADKIKAIIKIVGNFALHIDPMEQWFSYIHKHPNLRKDEFKGVASVAQELYNICDIAKELVEAVEQKELSPFLEFLKSDFGYVNSEKINSYAEGEDILAIKKGHANLTAWIKKNTRYINILFVKHPEWQKTDFLKIANELQKKLDDFQERYGDVRYVGNLRTIHPSEKKLDELDPETKRHVQMFMKANNIPADELQTEITQAINSRLSDLRREVATILHNIGNMLGGDISRIEHEKNMSVGPIQEKYSKENKGSKIDQGILSAKFWREYLPKEQEVFQKELDNLDRLKSELYGIEKEIWLVFCAKCREKYVVVHQMHYDEKLSNEAICDDCISTKELETIKSGEWRCGNENNKGEICNAMLYKFAHNNILSSILKNTANTKVTLNYGQMEIEISCPKCRAKSRQVVEWGWLP